MAAESPGALSPQGAPGAGCLPGGLGPLGCWAGTGLPQSLPTFGSQPGCSSSPSTPSIRMPAHHEVNPTSIWPWGWRTFSGQ